MPDKLIDPTSVSHMFRLSENHGCVSTGVISTCCLAAHSGVVMLLGFPLCACFLRVGLPVSVWVGLSGGVVLEGACANSCSLCTPPLS